MHIRLGDYEQNVFASTGQAPFVSQTTRLNLPETSWKQETVRVGSIVARQTNLSDQRGGNQQKPSPTWLASTLQLN